MSENLVTLRNVRGRAVVFVHPASGIATAFRHLVPYMPENCALFAFENVEPEGPPPSIEMLSERYWLELQNDVLEPITFVGWSFGGTVALEMATIASEAARDVAAVILLDAGARHIMLAAPSLPVQDLAGLFGISPNELPSDATPDCPDEMLGLVVDILRKSHGMDGIESADLQPFIDAYRWHHEVVRKPWTYRGSKLPVHLVRARDERCWDAMPADLGWSVVLGSPPCTWWTPGTHHDLAAIAHAPELAQVLTMILAQGKAAFSHHVRDREG